LALSQEAALVAALARRDGLFVLDNCEHLLDGVRECVDLIVEGCPRVTILATSRMRLMLPYERVYPVPGLAVTEDAGGDAVALFAARVAPASGGATLPDPARAAALCRALDGVALAIELAASRYATLGLDGLEAGLQDQMRFLAGTSRVGSRHRSLRDTIAWSYDLLIPADQALLRHLAVFASWFDVSAAHAVAAADSDRAAVADGLGRLADHSLLVVDNSLSRVGDDGRQRAPIRSHPPSWSAPRPSRPVTAPPSRNSRKRSKRSGARTSTAGPGCSRHWSDSPALPTVTWGRSERVMT
jgi:predicted ATPase